MKYLYYPYSRCLNEVQLKKAVLAFDSIVFLDNQPIFMRNADITKNHTENEQLLAQAYYYLQNEGIVTIYNPTEIVKKKDLLITCNTTKDLKNREYCDLAIHYSTETWNYSATRIPKSFIEAFYPGTGTYYESRLLQQILACDGNRSTARLTFDGHWMNRFPEELSLEELWSIFDERYKYVIGGNPIIHLAYYNLPFLQASSLRINEALLVCLEEGYIPFTDSTVHQQLLNKKVTAVYEELRTNNKIRELLDIPYEIPKTMISLEVIEQILSDDEISQMEFLDIIEYKKDNKELFERYKNKINELAATINNIDNPIKLQRDIQRIIDKDVIPELNDIRRKLRLSYKSNIGKIVLQSSGVLVPTIAMLTTGGVGYSTILKACALAELGYLTSTGADRLIDLAKAKNESSTNDFQYILNLK